MGKWKTILKIDKGQKLRVFISTILTNVGLEIIPFGM